MGMKKLLALMLATCGLAAQPMLPVTQYTFGFLTNATSAEARAYLGAQGTNAILSVLSTNTIAGTGTIVLSSVTDALGAGTGDFMSTGVIPMSGDLNMDGNNITNAAAITATGTVTAGSVSTDSLAVGGTGTNWISTPLYQHILDDTTAYVGSEVVAGTSANGIAQGLWVHDLPEGFALGLTVRISGDGYNTNYSDVLDYAFRRPLGELPAVAWTNHVRGRAEHYVSVVGNEIVLAAKAPEDQIMYSIGRVEWWRSPLGTLYDIFDPMYLFDFEDEIAADTALFGWTVFAEVGSTHSYHFGYDVEPLEGLQSLWIDTGEEVSKSFTATYPMSSGYGDLYAAGMVTMSDAAKGNHSLFTVNSSTTDGNLELGTLRLRSTGVVHARASGGVDSTNSIVTLTPGEPAWWKTRWQKGADADAIFSIWFTTNVASGWGEVIASGGGTRQLDARRLIFSFSSATATNEIRHDYLTVSTNDIPISHFE